MIVGFFLLCICIVHREYICLLNKTFKISIFHIFTHDFDEFKVLKAGIQLFSLNECELKKPLI